MLFKDISIFDGGFKLHEHQYVGVDTSGRIAYIGDGAPADPDAYGEVYDGRRKLLMPGMFNAHAHAPMTLLRGYAENLPLQRWLFEMVFPFEARMTDDDVLPAMRLAVAEMLRFGTVGFSDMYFNSDVRAQVVGESGIKCNMSHSISDFAGARYADTPFKGIHDHLISAYHGAFDGRLLVEYCLHSEYTTREPIVRDVAAAARESGLGLQVHVSETRQEHEECKQRHGGLTPVQYLEACGVLDVPVTAAHCVWLEPQDIEIMKAHGATVATCPASNMKLGSGVPPIPRYLDAGLRVALGTDGPASNNNHNMFQDLYLMLLANRGVDRDPVGITPEQALTIATANGAQAQGREDCGKLEPGFKADLIVLDLDSPWMMPVTDLARNVVYAANGSDVVLTMVDGRVLYRDGEYLTIDIERAMFETQAARDSIVSRL
ncbi:MAG: amidohydrolase [Coriobacteriales bacterium]|nr:amidohydrolase [Coriobacteriales bacterium]